jgi:hypothetical protein
MAIARQVVTSIQSDGTDMLGTKSVAVKIADESIVPQSHWNGGSNSHCRASSRSCPTLSSCTEIELWAVSDLMDCSFDYPVVNAPTHRAVTG